MSSDQENGATRQKGAEMEPNEPRANESTSSGHPRRAKKRLDRNNTDFPLRVYEELSHINHAGTPYEFLKYHQNIVRHFVTNLDIGSKGILVKHSMGTGKSIVAVAIIVDLLLASEGVPYKILVLLTKSLKENFRQNIFKYIKLRTKHEPNFALGNIPDNDIYNWIDSHFNFVTLRSSAMIRQVIKATEGAITRDLERIDKKIGRLVEIGSLDNTCMVVDEAHHLFRAIINGSQNGLRLYDMAMNAKNNKVVFMTGTPIEDDPFTIVPCFNMLAGFKLFPEDYEQFRDYFIDDANYCIKNKGKFQNRIMGLVSSVHYMDQPGKNAKIRGFSGENIGANFPEKKPTKYRFVPMEQSQYQQYQLARENETNEAVGRKTQPARMQKPKGMSVSSYRQKSRQLSNYCPPEKYRGAKFSDIKPDDLSDAEVYSPKMEAMYKDIMADEGIGLVYSQFTGTGGLGIFGRYLISKGWRMYNQNNISKITNEESPEVDGAGARGGSEIDQSWEQKGYDPKKIIDEVISQYEGIKNKRARKYMSQFLGLGQDVPRMFRGQFGGKAKKRSAVPTRHIKFKMAKPDDINNIADLIMDRIPPKKAYDLSKSKEYAGARNHAIEILREYFIKPNFILVQKSQDKVISAIMFKFSPDPAEPIEPKYNEAYVEGILNVGTPSLLEQAMRDLEDILRDMADDEHYQDLETITLRINNTSKDDHHQLLMARFMMGMDKSGRKIVNKSAEAKKDPQSSYGSGRDEDKDDLKNMHLFELEMDNPDHKTYIDQISEMWPEGIDAINRLSSRQKAGDGSIGAKILTKKAKLKAVAIYDYTDGDIVITEAYIRAPRYREAFYRLYIKYAYDNAEKAPFNKYIYIKVAKNSNLEVGFYGRFGCAKLRESPTHILYRCDLNWGKKNYLGGAWSSLISDNTLGKSAIGYMGGKKGSAKPEISRKAEKQYIGKDKYFGGLKICKLSESHHYDDIDAKYLTQANVLIYGIESEDGDHFGHIVIDISGLTGQDSHRQEKESGNGEDNITAVISHMNIKPELAENGEALKALFGLVRQMAANNGFAKIVYYAPQDVIHGFLDNIGFKKIDDNRFVMPTTRDALGAGSIIGGANAGNKAKTFAIISGQVPADERAKIVEELNGNDNIIGQKISLLLISATGAEGLDLHNVRSVYKMEPYWNKARDEQVDARGVRNDSHINQPPDKQNVQPYTYISVPPEPEKGPKPDYDAIFAEIVKNNTMAGHEDLITTDFELLIKSNLSAKIRDSFLRAIDDVAVECVLNGHKTCKVCKPNHRKLFTDNLADDAARSDPCEQYQENVVSANKIEIDGKVYFWVERPGANAFGIIVYEYSPDMAIYTEIPTNSPIFRKVVEKVKPDTSKVGELINEL